MNDPKLKPFLPKDYDDIVTLIDELHGDAIQVFGPDSLTAAACKALYDIACKEAKTLEGDSDD